MTIKVDELADAIAKELQNYSEEVTKAMKQTIDTVADMAMQEIKDHVTFKQPSGDYVKAFKLKTTESSRAKSKTWYVDKPHYRLTHLLEKGHALRNGGRTEAFPHIKFGDELVQRELEKKMKEAIENAGTKDVA